MWGKTANGTTENRFEEFIFEFYYGYTRLNVLATDEYEVCLPCRKVNAVTIQKLISIFKPFKLAILPFLNSILANIGFLWPDGRPLK